MDDSASAFRIAIRSVRPFLIFRPHSGHFWLDVLLVFIVAALHFTILPTIFGRIIPVDILTPWLLTYFVAASFKKSLAIGILVALIMESHTSAPAGMYLSLFWVVLVTLWLVKISLSWRHAFPWIVTFAAGEAWIIFSEFFVHSVNLSAVSVTLPDIASQLGRMLFAIGAGMFFSRRIRIEGTVEDSPL